jgi:Fe-S-cluster-containing dehydrogenase component/anaerobic selenocysteine-containing dehydrogenase
MSSIKVKRANWSPEGEAGAGYWKSLGELAVLSGQGADPGTHTTRPVMEPSAVNRRRFLGLLSSTLAAAGVGCGRYEDRGEIVAYPDAMEDVIPGVPRHYASTLVRYPGAPAVLVTTREGRPIKLEGNPDHPASQGALGAFGQAATLDLYDPDRLRRPLYEDQELPWEEASRLVRQRLDLAHRTRRTVLLLTPPIASPSYRAVIKAFIVFYPNVRHLVLDVFDSDQKAEGERRAFGAVRATRVRWDRADLVLSVECDFLGAPAEVTDEIGFSRRRRPENQTEMNRLWAVESSMTLTGANADHRLPIRPSDQGRFLTWLLDHLVRRKRIGPLAADAGVREAAELAAREVDPGGFFDSPEAAEALVSDLIGHRGKSVVLAGAILPASHHVLVAALNLTLGNEGEVLETLPVPAWSSASSMADWGYAASEMSTGRVESVICLQANPVYALPPDLGFGAALKRVPMVISSSLLRDETAAAANLVLPAAHDLESWGDSDHHPGILSLQQPTIQPLFGARQDEQLLLDWHRENEPYREFLIGRWRNEVYLQTRSSIAFEEFWEAALHEGFITLPLASPPALRLQLPGVAKALEECRGNRARRLDLVLVPGSRTYDGRFANNGWLQELPHPVTTQVWGNAALVSPATAAALGVREGQPVTVKVQSRTATFPVLIQPGVAADTLIVELGYGRISGGSAGTGIGVDSGQLRSSGGGLSPWIYQGVEAVPGTGRMPLARVQDHHSAEGRPIVRETSALAYRENTKLPAAGHHDRDSSHTWDYPGHKWGMVIDLSACTGCGACTVACMAENNIPVVGPDEVARGREMHWVRIDRYYKGDSRNPQVVYQPMLCQHCDYAPCEKVCPVAATVHSPEGLDEMVYNRCVGTRYCANNCPYKVRRFNFVDYHQKLRSPGDLVLNPEVTVRSRGVMEKCTFCVQRIAAAKQAAKAEGRELRDRDVQTACQQACPAGAIVFGDLNDQNSQVHLLSGSSRGYQALGEIGVHPAITYLAKIRNPYPGFKL